MESLRDLGRRAGRRAAAVTGAAVLGAAFLSPPAAAEQVEAWHERFTSSVIAQDEHGDEFCGGSFDSYDVLMEGDVMFNGHVVRRGDGEFYWAESINATTTFTNVETGATLVTAFKARDADVGFSYEGNTVTISAASRGTLAVYANDVLIAREAGLVNALFTFDNGGTPDDESDDVFTGPEIVDYAGLFEGRDLCEDMHSALD